MSSRKAPPFISAASSRAPGSVFRGLRRRSKGRRGSIPPPPPSRVRSRGGRRLSMGPPSTGLRSRSRWRGSSRCSLRSLRSSLRSPLRSRCSRCRPSCSRWCFRRWLRLRLRRRWWRWCMPLSSRRLERLLLHRRAKACMFWRTGPPSRLLQGLSLLSTLRLSRLWVLAGERGAGGSGNGGLRVGAAAAFGAAAGTGASPGGRAPLSGRYFGGSGVSPTSSVSRRRSMAL